MPPALTIRLLGTPEIHAAGVRLDISASRAIPIVTLLAAAEARVPRERIASLLWRRVEAASALASLRQVLHHLPEALRAAIDADRASLALDRSAVDCDLWRLRSATDAAAIVAAYGAPLLEGRVFDDFPEFDDWLRLERARIATRVRGAVQDEMARIGPDHAEELARRWLDIEPADEEVHARLMQAHVAAGRIGSAEAQYEELRRVLATVWGRAPQPATRAILENALRDRGGPRGAGITPVATSFVGRHDELAEIARLLLDPHCRLVTLHGPGGVGKTRLAMAFAEEAARHGEVVRYAGLEAAQSLPAFLASLAAALGIEVSSRQDPRARILSTLESLRMVLVLDNFEQLLGGGADSPAAGLFVAEMLRAAPHLKVIVTSRVALGLQEEWLVPVEGLAYPAGDEAGGGAEAAVELFVSRARQAYRGFSGAAERPHILAICRAAEGLPLAIELAAAQVGSRPCAEIARDLLAEPAGRAANRPDRQASVLRVVEQSLAAASADEARAFAALSLFQGEFTPAQAFAVARVGEGVLSELVSRALLQRAQDRLRMHPLLRQVAFRRLQKTRAVARRVEEGYVADVARRSQEELRRLLGRDARAAVASLPGRVDDELHALRLAAAHGDTRHVELLAESVSEHGPNGFAASCRAGWPDVDAPNLEPRARAHLLLRRALLTVADIAAALADLDAARVAAGQGVPDEALRHQIDYGIAHFKMWNGEYREAVALCEGLGEGLVDSLPVLARVRRAELLGTAFAELGELDRARALLDREYAALVARDASGWLLAHVLNPMGAVAQYAGDYERCAAVHREAIERLTAEGFVSMCAAHECNLGAALKETGDLDGAEAAFARSLRIANAGGLRGPLAYSGIGLAWVAFERGDHAAAQRHAAEACAVARAMGSAAVECESAALIARSQIEQGDLLAARKQLLEVEERTRGQDLGFRRMQAAYYALRVAALLPGAPEPQEMARTVAALLAEPTCTQLIRDEIEAWAREAKLPPPSGPGVPYERAFELLAPRAFA